MRPLTGNVQIPLVVDAAREHACWSIISWALITSTFGRDASTAMPGSLLSLRLKEPLGPAAVTRLSTAAGEAQGAAMSCSNVRPAHATIANDTWNPVELRFSMMILLRSSHNKARHK